MRTSTMTKFRSPWLALLGGVTLIALSMSTAFAGKPDGTNRGLQVSAYVHSLVGADEETDTDTETTDETETDTDTETTDETDVEVEDSASSDHGQCVREVATDKEAVSGDNDNHGGAVSEAARFTCWGEEVPAADSEGSAAADTEASTKGHGHGKGHAKHGG
jgi:hypothetical protein